MAPAASEMVVAQDPAPMSSLYIQDLHLDVNDVQLFNHFAKFGTVTAATVCRNSVTGTSLGYGYVNYVDPRSAFEAIEKLNHTTLLGKPIRIMWSHRDAETRFNGPENLFVKNLCKTIDNMKLQDIFSTHGTIVSCKVSMHNERSKGYGYVQFDNEDSANKAIEKLNGATFFGKELYVTHYVKKSERTSSNPETRYTNLYMKNLDEDITVELIELKFSEFGKILSATIAKDADGNSKGFGFVNFETHDSAKRAVEAMNGLQLGSKVLYVARAQKKEERQQILRRLYDERRNEQIKKNMTSNVYIKNLDDGIDEDILHEHFGQCGNIASAKVMRDEKGISRGFGFVCFSTPEEANNAVATLHGCMFHGKPLYVAIAQRKEERRAQLKMRFAQRMSELAAVQSPVMPSVYYSQIPPRQGLMYPHIGMRSGWRPNALVPQLRPNFPPPMSFPNMIPPNAARQYRQNIGRMNGTMLPQLGQPISYMSHLHQSHPAFNLLKDSNGYAQSVQSKRVPNRHQPEVNISNGPASNLQDGMEMLSSMLAAASPEQRKQMLGERIFPLVHNLKPDLAAKITGMLLEMDNNELLLLLESPESLAAKVDEAVDVLEQSKTKVGGDSNNFLSAEVAAS